MQPSSTSSVPNQPAGPIGSVLANARDVAFIMAIFLYFAGFMYNYYYQEAWGITGGRSVVDIFGYLVYSYAPLSAAWLWLLSVVLVSGVCLLGTDMLLRTQAFQRYSVALLAIRMLIIAVAVTSFFPLLALGARQAAVSSVDRIREGRLPAARLYFTDAFRRALQKGGGASSDVLANLDDVTIVEETADSYYILDQPEMTWPHPPVGTLLRIPKSEVRYIATQVITPGTGN